MDLWLLWLLCFFFGDVLVVVSFGDGMLFYSCSGFGVNLEGFVIIKIGIRCKLILEVGHCLLKNAVEAIDGVSIFVLGGEMAEGFWELGDPIGGFWKCRSFVLPQMAPFHGMPSGRSVIINDLFQKNCEQFHEDGNIWRLYWYIMQLATKRI